MKNKIKKWPQEGTRGDNLDILSFEFNTTIFFNKKKKLSFCSFRKSPLGKRISFPYLGSVAGMSRVLPGLMVASTDVLTRLGSCLGKQGTETRDGGSLARWRNRPAVGAGKRGALCSGPRASEPLTAAPNEGPGRKEGLWGHRRVTSCKRQVMHPSHGLGKPSTGAGITPGGASFPLPGHRSETLRGRATQHVPPDSLDPWIQNGLTGSKIAVTHTNQGLRNAPGKIVQNSEHRLSPLPGSRSQVVWNFSISASWLT